MYYLFSDPSGNCSLRPGCTITFWERWGVGGGGHLQSSFCYCPWLSEVYELKLALKCGSGGCNVFDTPKVLSSRAGNFDLHGPQVRIVWISYWILNTGYQIRNYSSFVHCLKIHKFNTFFKIRNQMHLHPSAVDPKLMTHCVYRSPCMNTAEATLVKRACRCACDRIGSPQGREITVWGMAWPIKCREFRDKRTNF
jgi:hypothetical protein